ncbi:MAG: plasmid stabilization protein [Bdellovibrio sp.]
MPRGSKEKYTDKQKRMAQHIEESAKESGYSPKRAAQIGWATTNKQTGGAGKKASSTSSSKKGASKVSSSVSHSARSKAAKKGWKTRRSHLH